ncbi:MAG: PfkB family carbohydrate kinase, partial [Pseudomonadota bacterium]
MSKQLIGKTLLHGMGHKILCIGDVMLDRYIVGTAERLSPEAPVPVVTNPEERLFAGGAANAALNIQGLGAEVHCFGVIGRDAEGEALDNVLGCPKTLIEDGSRPTTIKRRILANGQQLLRLDREVTKPIAREVAYQLLDRIASEITSASLIALSDYGKGVLSPYLLKRIQALAEAHNVGIICDPYPPSMKHYGSMTCLKPNISEAQRLTGLRAETDLAAETVIADLLSTYSVGAVVLTRGPDGLSFGQRGEPVYHFAGERRPVFDVTGAGDTAFAGLALGLAAGQSLEASVELSARAASCSVSRNFTSAVSLDDVLAGASPPRGSDAFGQVARNMAIDRSNGLRIGFTNGCFDVLHPGHLSLLKAARAKCDRLVLALNSDLSVRGLKGQGRPVNPIERRAGKLAALDLVDHIVSFDAPTPIDLITTLSPDILIKGAEYDEAD